MRTYFTTLYFLLIHQPNFLNCCSLILLNLVTTALIFCHAFSKLLLKSFSPVDIPYLHPSCLRFPLHCLRPFSQSFPPPVNITFIFHPYQFTWIPLRLTYFSRLTFTTSVSITFLPRLSLTMPPYFPPLSLCQPSRPKSQAGWRAGNLIFIIRYYSV